jgi:hypothetical protein
LLLLAPAFGDDANKTDMVTAAASPLFRTDDQERGAAKKAKPVVQTHDAKRTVAA